MAYLLFILFKDDTQTSTGLRGEHLRRCARIGDVLFHAGAETSIHEYFFTHVHHDRNRWGHMYWGGCEEFNHCEPEASLYIVRTTPAWVLDRAFQYLQMYEFPLLRTSIDSLPEAAKVAEVVLVRNGSESKFGVDGWYRVRSTKESQDILQLLDDMCEFNAPSHPRVYDLWDTEEFQQLSNQAIQHAMNGDRITPSTTLTAFYVPGLSSRHVLELLAEFAIYQDFVGTVTRRLQLPRQLFGDLSDPFFADLTDEAFTPLDEGDNGWLVFSGRRTRARGYAHKIRTRRYLSS